MNDQEKYELEQRMQARVDHAQRVKQLKELEAKLEKHATSHPADRVDERLKGQEYIEEVARKACASHPNWIDKSIVESSAEKPDCISDQEPNLIISDGKGNSLGFNVDLPLSFEAYQASAKKTAIYNQDARVLYPALGLSGEVGELIEKASGISVGMDILLNGIAVSAGKCANQVKKIIRDDDCECDTPRKNEIGKEIGGVLWYCAAVASDLGLDLGAIAQKNLDILADRQKRGKIQGDGDNR